METESFEFNLDEYRNNAVWPQLLADNVAEELILYFIMEESRFLMELVLPRILRKKSMTISSGTHGHSTYSMTKSHYLPVFRYVLCKRQIIVR